jgi:hypothetical protein
VLYDERIFGVYAPESREGPVISRWNFGEGGTIAQTHHQLPAKGLHDADEQYRGFHESFDLLTAALSELAPVAKVLAIVP